MRLKGEHGRVTKRSVQQREQAGEQRWLVRNEQEEVFGPVGFETLKAWARDGRLSPTSVVSEDAVAWSPVAHVPGLEMNWVAEVSPGVFYGPIHYQALRELQGDGTIAPTAVLFARDAGGVCADAALAACVGQAEQAQKWLTMQVAQLTAQLAERDAQLQRFEQQAADVNMLQLLAQEIISAQEMGTRQVLDAVANAQASVAGQAEVLQEVATRQVMDRRVVLNAVAGAQGKASADIVRELAQGRQAMLDAFSEAQEKIAGRVVHEVSAQLPPKKSEQAADAQAKATHDAVSALAQDVKAGQGQLVSAVGDAVAPLTRQVRQLSEEVQALEKTLADKVSACAPEPKVERVYVEAEVVEAEVIPSAPHEAQARPAAQKAAAAVPPGMGGGLSMAELEQQAQRELERLGAQGVNLFKRTK